MDLGLSGRRALVTAASKGLGRACAATLIAEGARVFISSRSPAATAREIGASGFLAADVADEREPEHIVQAAVDALGGLDVLIVNAGGPRPGTFQDVPLSSWDDAFQLTLMSAVRLVHSALPYLKQSDQARIVFIGSISVRQPLPYLVLSNSLRAAVAGLAKTLSLELAGDRITVNSVAPDAILTDRIRQLAGGDELGVKAMGERAPMGRLGTPEEFAAAVVFLCSRQAAYISGQTIGVDGGSLRGVH
ncbi:MAG TPA: SDR family oxidoreductase [Candidatus Dormibacteraeota bacterium]|nr:SDR family oxidoreductase [Candidatus Dormibacteraeota bacterium]